MHYCVCDYFFWAALNNKKLSTFRVWLDIFAINQHLPTEDLSQLHDVIKHSRNFILVADVDGKPLRRVWCLFEIMTWIVTPDKPQMFTFVGTMTQSTASPTDGNEHTHACIYDQMTYVLMLCASYTGNGTIATSSYSFDTAEHSAIMALISTIDMEKSEATVASDREMIFKDVIANVRRR
jgi:hypothetical protein